MVKKSSIFARLRERFGGGSVRLSEGRGGEPARASVQRVASGRALATGTGAGDGDGAEPATSRKLTEREEAMVALNTHFQELSGLLRGVQSRMDGQTGRLADVAEALRQLPALGQQQQQTLTAMAAQLDRNNTLHERLAVTLQNLPAVLTNVESALQRAAAADERTERTVKEFGGVLERMHGAMDRVVHNSDQQAQAMMRMAEARENNLSNLAQTLEVSQRDAVRELRHAADDGLAALRRSHEDQSNRLQRVVVEHAGWSKAVMFTLGLLVLGIGAVVTLLLFK